MSPASRWGSAPVLLALVAVSPLYGQEPWNAALEPPPPEWEVRLERSHWIPMRDGVRLSADLYFPEGAPGPLPVVLIRTPYDKRPLRAEGSEARFFASHGFAVAVQDFRGKFGSEGTYHFTRGHPEDGYDTIEWLAAQQWSNGKVGTYGCSYVGEVQLYQAQSRPPHLAAMIPQAAGSMVGSAGGYYHNALDLGSGVWGLGLLVPWWRGYGSQVYYRPPPGLSREELLEIEPYFEPGPSPPERDLREVFRTLPTRDVLARSGAPPTEYEEFIVRQLDLTDPWWDQYDYLAEHDSVSAPALFIESWNDWTASAALYARNLFERTGLSPTARDNQFIIVSPASHCGSEEVTADQWIGDQHVGDPRFGHGSIYLDWFDHWLKGVDNGITAMPKVQYYLIGENRWKAADAWPIPGTTPLTLHLSSGGRANSHFGDGRLGEAEPGDELPDVFTYDPAMPVPTLGVNDYWGSKPITDQRPVSARTDVLVYTTDPLDETIEVTGDIEVVLYVSSSARDTDFHVKLVDVHPDGMALNVREGMLRARYRDGRDRPARFLEPREVARLRIPLGAYSQTFPASHRIRLQVTSSSFPRYERNLNTGGRNVDETEWVVAENRIHHAPGRASYLVLPVVRR